MDFASPSTRGEGAQATRRLIDLVKTLRVGVTKVRFRSSTTFCGTPHGYARVDY
jgi:hypothetical protein